MNDPFAEEPQQEFPKVHHGRTDSKIAAGGRHPRTVSDDIDDHMEGSVHLGTDVCPSCGYVRMSSVYCPVSQLHHGTDLPLETPSKKKKASLFSRIRDSMSGLSPHPPTEDVDEQAASPCAPHQSHPALPDDAATCGDTPETSGIRWPLFSKTKEEKAVADINQLEEKERKSIYELHKLAVHEIDRQLTNVHKAIREIIRGHDRAKNVVAHECKQGFDKLYLERKQELEEIRTEFQLELKLLAKKEKERRKHLHAAAGDRGNLANSDDGSGPTSPTTVVAGKPEGAGSGLTSPTAPQPTYHEGAFTNNGGAAAATS